jgi:hypothetical protein
MPSCERHPRMWANGLVGLLLHQPSKTMSFCTLARLSNALPKEHEWFFSFCWNWMYHSINKLKVVCTFQKRESGQNSTPPKPKLQLQSQQGDELLRGVIQSDHQHRQAPFLHQQQGTEECRYPTMLIWSYKRMGAISQLKCRCHCWCSWGRKIFV